MDRNTLIRTVVIFGAIILIWKFVLPMFTGGGSKGTSQAVAEEIYVNAPDFAPDPMVEPEPTPDPNAPPPVYAEPESCKIKGNRFSAELSTRGAALTHLFLADAQYGTGTPYDMVTSNWDAPSAWAGLERWRPLRTTFRADGANDQLKYDRFNWKVESLGDTGCKFSYADADVQIEKTVRAGERPFELDVETKLTNLADGPRKHKFNIETFAFRQNSEMKGHLGRVSPFVTELSCARTGEVTRKARDDFKESGWFSQAATDRYAGISNYYFAQALIPEGGVTAECDVLAEDWFTANQKHDDDEAGVVFHSRLAYEPKSLDKGQTATYSQTAFFGPKERDVLKTAGGPGKNLGDLINLGFFSPVAKVLIGALVILKNKVTGSWGLAIIVLTLGLKLVLFPLTWKSIKTTVSMRRLKPDLDDLNKRFAGDMQAKNLAMMELYKKKGVNPFGGCLPQVVQMPVWFAMYTTLQTAVEMYHTHFLWFKDLSAPDQLFGYFGPLPIVLGAFMILQQRIVPQQAMDPMQQKMMTYILPLVFTVMMLFLPAALGVYMLTNSVLNITQQLLVEKFAPRDGGGGKPGEIVVKEKRDQDPTAKTAALGKGKSRV